MSQIKGKINENDSQNTPKENEIMIYPLNNQNIENVSVNKIRKKKNMEYCGYCKKYVIVRKLESIKCCSCCFCLFCCPCLIIYMCCRRRKNCNDIKIICTQCKHIIDEETFC